AKLAPATTTSHWHAFRWSWSLDRSSMPPACRCDGCAAWGGCEAGAKRFRAGVQPCLPAINAALTAGYAAGSTMAGNRCRRTSAMTRFAEHVYTEQSDIARIESWAEQLEDEARVEIRLADGERVEGFVTAR